MRVILALCLMTAWPAAAAQSGDGAYELRFSGRAAADALCASLLAARRAADAQGRLDFSVAVRAGGTDASTLVASVRPGAAFSIGRIDFTGHRRVNDGTLRRALTIAERDHLDVRELRRSLARIDALRVFEPVAASDVILARRPDQASVDLTIHLRERRLRWWSVSSAVLPGSSWLQASVASRLPPWGRGLLEAATYFVSLNIAPLARPFVALQRPLVPGQWLFSGFAVSPALSPRHTLIHYGRTHLVDAAVHALRTDVPDRLEVAMLPAGGKEQQTLTCTTATSRVARLRRGAAAVADLAAAWLLP